MYIIQVSKDLCKMVGYETTESINNGGNQGGQGVRRRQVGQSKPLSWGHLPNGGTVANLGNIFVMTYHLQTVFHVNSFRVQFFSDFSVYLTAIFLFNLSCI